MIKQALSALGILLLLLCSCDTTLIDEGCRTVTDPVRSTTGQGLTGAWKVVGFRIGGGNASIYNPFSYMAFDAENNTMAIMTNPEKRDTGLPFAEFMTMEATDETITLYRIGSDEPEYSFPYHLIDDEEGTLYLYPKAVSIIDESLLDGEPGTTEIVMTLARDRKIESKALSLVDQAETKGLSDIWKKVCDIVETAYDYTIGYVVKKVYSNLIEPLLTTPTVEPWANTGGWKPENWMSHLNQYLHVCEVNIPGTHDSSTSKKNMSAEAIAVSADCQTYDIIEQFEKGARYFDLRVGNEFTWDRNTNAKRLPNDMEIAQTADLMMYHGNFASGQYYKETLRELAKKVKGGDKSEFIFINTQFEDLSYGLIDAGVLLLDEKLGKKINGTDVKKYFVNRLSKITMDIANRIQREVNEEFGGDLYVNYSPDLLVKYARGHIILMEGIHDEQAAQDNPQCSYIMDWHDNSAGLSNLASYDKCPDSERAKIPSSIVRKGRSYNMFIQSEYEMRLDEKDKIQKKCADFYTVADSVAIYNYRKAKHILGFNALNANGGAGAFYDLDVYEFAHIFNAFGVNLFANNMLEKEGSLHFRGGIVSMDHLGADKYFSPARMGLTVDVYGDKLVWAVIESNFYTSDPSFGY